MGLYEYNGDETVTIVLDDGKTEEKKPNYIRDKHKSYGQDCPQMCIFWRQGNTVTDPGWQIGRGRGPKHGKPQKIENQDFDIARPPKIHYLDNC